MHCAKSKGPRVRRSTRWGSWLRFDRPVQLSHRDALGLLPIDTTGGPVAVDWGTLGREAGA